ncbi:hypothetical protein GCM10010980_18010 [Corynebacterium marinum]|nr:hypothetical protein GCM10010980_18010 [Corynebacterium marinum]
MNTRGLPGAEMPTTTSPPLSISQSDQNPPTQLDHLRHQQPFRRTPEVQFLGHCHEVLELASVHGGSLRRNTTGNTARLSHPPESACLTDEAGPGANHDGVDKQGQTGRRRKV